MSEVASENASALAAVVRGLSNQPPLVVHSGTLRELADALDGRTDLAVWNSVDLVGTFARPDLLRARAPQHDRRDWLLSVAQSIAVFVPIVITWFGLTLATGAYQEMIAETDGPEQVDGRSFLQLWQQGFDGHLPAAFTFGWLAVYTLVAIAGVVGLNLYGAYRTHIGTHRSRDEVDTLHAELVPVLVRAQVAAKAAELAWPARFAAELVRSADKLGWLVDRASVMQRDLGHVGSVAGSVAAELSVAASSVGDAISELRRSADAVARSAARTENSAATLASTITETTATAASILERTGGELDELLTASARSHSSALAGLGDRVDDAVAALRETSARLADAGGELSASLGRAGREGATAIGDTYREAIAAAATSLGREMIRVGEGLADTVEDLRAVTEQHHERSILLSHNQTSTVATLAGAAKELEESLRESAAQVRPTSAATPRPRPVTNRNSRPTRVAGTR